LELTGRSRGKLRAEAPWASLKAAQKTNAKNNFATARAYAPALV